MTPTPIRPLEPMLKNDAPEEEATLKRLSRLPAVPCIASFADGVVEPIPILPFCRIVKSCVPVDDATENGLTPPRPCTLKVMVDEVALIPATVPLSTKVEVPRVVADSHRVAKPDWPPVIVEAESPRVDVATQRVVVPVVCSTIPRVPEAEVESKSAPRIVRLVAVAVVTRKLVDDPLVAKKVVVVALFAKRLEVDAFVAAKLLVAVALVKRPLEPKRVPERVRLVPDAFCRDVCPVAVRVVV